jgi:hypothetical protein
VGRVLQDPYDPYRLERAKAEEFGDVLAEGLFGCWTRIGLPLTEIWRIGVIS